MENNNSIEKGKITLEMLSDWHIGTGAGIPGGVDALLVRDADGFPCIPAKTQVGIWRDSLETLTYGLDDGDKLNKVWQNWVDVIFGSQPNIDKNPNETPRPAILSIQPARLDENLRNAIENSGDIDRTKYKQALTFVKANTQIESESGTAEKDSLRFTEMGRIGSVLEAEFALDFEHFNEDEKNLIKALLTASAGMVERIGGNRRRGAGKCAIQILNENGNVFGLASAVKTIENSKDNAKAIFGKILNRENQENNSQISTNSDAKQTEDKTNETDSRETWKRIEFSLTLQTPVAIVTETLGNVSVTLDFIPGTYLLPHITKNLNGISKYIATGDFQVLPATIEIQGNRGLAVPKVIHYHKVEGGFDKSMTVYNRLSEDISGGEQKKNFREGYLSTLDERKDETNNNILPFYETTKKVLLMHNTIEDKVQRPTENVGGVFSRQAIQAGQTLKGEIRFKEAIGKSLDFSTLGGFVRLGTSKKDDYGLAELKFETSKDSTSSSTATNNLIVYLASDVLLRNDNLRQTNLVSDLKKILEKELGTGTLKILNDFIKPLEDELLIIPKTEEVKRTEIKAEIEKIKKEKKNLISMIQVRRIESWHEGWGFPRPTLTAMAAGSVVVFEIVKTIDPTKLQNLELSGIGERRGEGYGQIKFNPKILTERINDWKVATKNDEDATVKEERREVEKLKRIEAIKKLKAGIGNAEKLKKFIENIELAVWRDELERAVLKTADKIEKRRKIFGFDSDTKTPPMSQIGGLRSTIGRLKLDGSNKNVVINWLKHLQATSNRKDKWKNKFGKIEEIFTEGKENKENVVWDLFKGFWTQPEMIISDEKELKKELWAEAVKSLFDAAARAHKRATEDK